MPLTVGEKLAVFSIRNTEQAGTVWTRVGSAFVNKDDSLNVYLDALPMDGVLHCRKAGDEPTQKKIKDQT